MTIGSKTIATAPIAYAIGTLNQDSQVAELNQDVTYRQSYADDQVAALSQSVGRFYPDARIATLQQRVSAPNDTRPPAAYVVINGVDYSSSTALDTVSVRHGEDQASTANVFVYQPDGATINIPSFHGKPIQISTHADPSDDTSDVIVLFTGTVERARYDRARRGIALECTDLRDERLGREDHQQLRVLTGGLYSEITQREGAEGREYVTELMKTVSGSLGYDRNGELLFYSWGVNGKTVNHTFTDADVAYDDIETEIQVRSEVVNRVSVQMDYRYSLLRVAETTVDAYRPRRLSLTDTRAFDRVALLTRMENLSPWELIEHSFYPLERADSYVTGSGNIQLVIDALWTAHGRSKYCQGINATLKRRVAQPVKETYTFTITAPQSVDAYGETVDGSSYRYAIDTEYDRSQWEGEEYRESTASDPAAKAAAERAKADNERQTLANAFECAYLIGKKELIRANRQSLVSFTRHYSIDAADVGQIVELDTRIISTTGQISSLEYTIADGIRQTSYQLSLSYMDTAVTPPAENWSQPAAPTKPSTDVTVTSSAEYNTDDRVFDVVVAEIGEQLTDEIEQAVESEFTLPLEVNDITLVNGY